MYNESSDGISRPTHPRGPPLTGEDTHPFAFAPEKFSKESILPARTKTAGDGQPLEKSSLRVISVLAGYSLGSQNTGLYDAAVPS
jgi:hypothetical protein